MRIFKTTTYFALCIITISCAMTHSLQRQTPTADIHLPSNGPVETPEIEDVERAVTRMRKISMNGGRDSAYLAEVERDSIGEVTMKGGTVPTVYVVAKSKTVAERNGEIALDFIIGIPATLQNNTWGLSLTPVVENNGTEEALQPLSIRGELFSEVQKRQYWQMNKYLNRILGDTTGLSSTVSLAAKYYEAYNRYLGNNKKRLAEKLETTYKETISFPYLSDPRLDSVLLRKGELRYYYTQRYRPTKNTHRLHLYFRGHIDAIDRSQYALANSDTLTYTVTSMLSLLDNEPRYMLKVIDKYVEVRDRNYITFPVGRANVIDTMGQNLVQLAKIERLMDTLINQYEFFVDSITIIASSSPDGSMATNNRIAGERARSIKERLVRKFGHEVDTLIRTRSIGEDWALLKRLIRHNSDMPNWEQITAMIDQSRNLDVTEPQIRQQFPKDYAYMKEILYPQLRAVDFRYNLRRKGMVKDTIHTTELDTTYMRGVELLQRRKYARALYILNDYNDRNTVVAHLSLDHNERALELLASMPKDAVAEYLKAIACSRLGRKEEGREHFLEACRLDERMEYRGNLDPEIAELLKQ